MPRNDDKVPSPNVIPSAYKILTDKIIHPIHFDKSLSSTSFIGGLSGSGRSGGGTNENGVRVVGGVGTGKDNLDKIRLQIEENLKVSRFELPALKIDFDFAKSINDIISRKLDDVITHNTKVLMLGAMLGAAIGAGVLIGIGTVSSLSFSSSSSVTKTAMSTPGATTSTSSLHSWNKNMYRRWNTWVKRNILSLFFMNINNHSDVGGSNGDSVGDSGRTENNNESTVDGNSNSNAKSKAENHSSPPPRRRRQGRSLLFILQASPAPSSRERLSSTSPSSPKEQCRQCLDSLTLSLGKRRLLWDDVLKLTVYLVLDRCDAETFRNILNEYPIVKEVEDEDEDENKTNKEASSDDSSHQSDNATYSTTSVVILYVQRLEDKNACVQVEALVQT